MQGSWGYSSFYRFREPKQTGGELALQEVGRRKPFPKNRVDPEVDNIVIVWVPCYGCATNLETFRKRLKSSEAKVAQDAW